VTIKLNPIRNEQPVSSVTVNGAITDDQSKAALVQKLIAAISGEGQKLTAKK